MLGNIHVVLSHTSHPGNIGASARAMKTMTLSRLSLVNPQHFPHADATARASGADDVLAGARVFEDIDSAIADCRLVIGASARIRSIPCPVVTPSECAQLAWQASQSGQVAILFGCEQSGLSNAEIDRCQQLVHIPGNPDYSSLNLAAAVQIICYEIHVASLGAALPGTHEQHAAVTAGEMELFYEHLEQALIELEFLNPENPRQLMRRLRRLFNRAGPDENEVNILRGMLSAAQAAVKQQS